MGEQQHGSDGPSVEGGVPVAAPVLRVSVSVEHGTVQVEGFRMAVPEGKTVHETAVHAAAVFARQSGTPRWCIAEDEAGRARFLVHPDGHSSDVAIMRHSVDDRAGSAGERGAAEKGAAP